MSAEKVSESMCKCIHFGCNNISIHRRLISEKRFAYTLKCLFTGEIRACALE